MQPSPARPDPPSRKQPPEACTVPEHHRVLIAAAVTAVLGPVWILGIRPVGWTRRRPAGVRSVPVVRHLSERAETPPDTDEEEETA